MEKTKINSNKKFTLSREQTKNNTKTKKTAGAFNVSKQNTIEQ